MSAKFLARAFKPALIALLLSGFTGICPAFTGIIPAYADSLFGDKLFSDDSLFTPEQSDTPAPREKDRKQEETDRAIAKLAAMQKEQAELSHSMYDNMLFNQMQKVAEWLDNYVVWNHRFPEQVNGGQDARNQTFGEGDELTWALRQMSLLIPNNPYKNGSVYNEGGWSINPQEQSNYGMPQTNEPTNSRLDMNRIQVIYVNTLKVADSNYYAQNPPPEWVAAPGTITIVTDRLYFFFVWGAGANGKPIRDPANGNVRMVLSSYQTWDQPQMQP
jgi:hypothetical protein